MKQLLTGNKLIDRYHYQMGTVDDLPIQDNVDRYIISRERIKKMAREWQQEQQEQQEQKELKKYIEQEINSKVIKELKNLFKNF